MSNPVSSDDSEVEPDAVSLLQCTWVPRVLDWERKLQPQPLLWVDRKDIEDPIDIGGDAITAAMKQSVAHLEQPRSVATESIAPSLAVPDNTIAGASSADATDPIQKPTTDESGQASPAPATSAAPAGSVHEQVNGDGPEEEAGPAVDYVGESSKLPLDVAVMESLAQCGSEDRLKRVITNILLVGGLSNMQGVGFALQSR